MPRFEQVKFLPFKPYDLFQMVMDIKSYPKFLPWCQAARIISQDQEQIIAELVIKFKSIVERYNSLITTEIEDENYLIKVVAISGMFKKLENSWRLSTHENGSKVEFLINIELKSMLYNHLIKMFFPAAAAQMMEAFEARAHNLFENQESAAK